MADAPPSAQETATEASPAPQEPHKTEQGEHASAVQPLPAANCAAQSNNAARAGTSWAGRTRSTSRWQTRHRRQRRQRRPRRSSLR